MLHHEKAGEYNLLVYENGDLIKIPYGDSLDYSQEYPNKIYRFLGQTIFYLKNHEFINLPFLSKSSLFRFFSISDSAITCAASGPILFIDKPRFSRLLIMLDSVNIVISSTLILLVPIKSVFIFFKVLDSAMARTPSEPILFLSILSVSRLLNVSDLALNQCFRQAGQPDEIGSDLEQKTPARLPDLGQ